MRLLSVTSPQFKHTMLHETKHENGMAKMRHIDSLLITKKETINLEPNGKHLMLMMPTESIWLRDNISFTLEFADHESVEKIIPIRKN